jgi:hypothetical protein
MSETTTLENVIPINTESPTTENTDLPLPTDANTIDLNTITYEDIINRIMDASKKMTFELLLALKLHEHIMARDSAQTNSESTPTEDAPQENAN